MLTNLFSKTDIAPYQAPPPLYGEDMSIWRHMSMALNQSLYRILSLLIAILPGILAFFAAVAVFALLGMILSALLRRVLTMVRFDDRVTRARGNVDWASSTPPTALVARLSFWACVVLGLIIGVSAFDASYATTVALPISLLPYLTHVVGAIFLLIVGTLFARFLARSILIEAVNAHLQYARIISISVRWVVLVLTAAMVLDHLQVGGNIVELAFGILFGGIILTFALAIGLGTRDFVSRTIDSHVQRGSERNPSATTSAISDPDDSIRHF